MAKIIIYAKKQHESYRHLGFWKMDITSPRMNVFRTIHCQEIDRVTTNVVWPKFKTAAALIQNFVKIKINLKVERVGPILPFLQKKTSWRNRHFVCFQSAVKLVSVSFVDVGKLQKLWKIQNFVTQ